MSSPDLPSPYPPGAQLFFRGVTSIRESTFAMRTAFVICDFAIAFVLLDMLRLNRQGGHLVLAYAWNPLLALEVAGSGHIDILGALLLLVSLAALGRRWRTTAAVGLGLAISIKLLPVVLLPLYWKRIRIRDAALAAIVVGLLYMPFLRHGHLSTGSLGTYVQSFRFNGPVFAMLDHVAPPRLLAGLAVLVGLVIAAWIRGAAPEWSAEVVAWPMAASLLFSPVVFPWYLLWLVPFVTSASTVLIFVWTVSIIPTYIMWHLRTIGRPWGPLPGWVMLLEYGSVALVAAILALRRGISRPKMLSRSTE
jgi:alpha-1,6-mannosyltransferase